MNKQEIKTKIKKIKHMNQQKIKTTTKIETKTKIKIKTKIKRHQMKIMTTKIM